MKLSLMGDFLEDEWKQGKQLTFVNLLKIGLLTVGPSLVWARILSTCAEEMYWVLCLKAYPNFRASNALYGKAKQGCMLIIRTQWYREKIRLECCLKGKNRHGWTCKRGTESDIVELLSETQQVTAKTKLRDIKLLMFLWENRKNKMNQDKNKK